MGKRKSENDKWIKASILWNFHRFSVWIESFRYEMTRSVKYYSFVLNERNGKEEIKVEQHKTKIKEWRWMDMVEIEVDKKSTRVV